MRKWYFLLALFFFVLGGSIYQFWALQREGRELTFAITSYSAKSLPKNNETIRIMTFNVAMGSKHFYVEWLYRGFLPFFITEHLDQVAQLIREEKPDIIILSEMAQNVLPFEHNLVGYLAQQSEMHNWAFAETTDRQIGWIRYIGGNAILSRYPLQLIPQPSDKLPLPLAALKFPYETVLVAGVHNDHQSWETNLKQTQQILQTLETRPSILAGDFNVPPESPSIRLLESSEQFSGEFHGPPTSPLFDNPPITIDFVFAPRTWQLVEHRVIANKISDHKAVLSTFKVITY
ncbi:MAG: hypothetical protein RIT27_1870 [Pseudomonadota bacterium]|jgi:endonuclease/exonuclease/phosphatase family metal-dependent hydrolase